MKRIETVIQRCVAVALAICLLTFVPASYAVVKNLSIVDGEGNSLANTKVTIVFPDGTEVDEETDDDGMLYYDFPKDGEYKVRYPGGQMAVNVSGAAGGGVTTGQWLGAGAAAAVIVGVSIVAQDSGRKSDSDSSSSSSSDPGSSGSGSSGSGSGSSGSGSVDPCQGDTFNFIGSVSTSILANPGSHPNNFDGDWEIFCDAGMDPRIVYVGSNMLNVEWSCPVDSGGGCSATTDCSYQGFSTVCTLASTFTSSNWNGQMNAGADGNLPPGGGSGEPITVSFDTPL